MMFHSWLEQQSKKPTSGKCFRLRLLASCPSGQHMVIIVWVFSPLPSPPMKNISTWTWGDYQWFVSGILFSALTVIPKAQSQNLYKHHSLFLYVEKLRPFGDDVLSQALRLYNSSAPCPTNDRCPERLYTTLVSDIRASCPSNHLAKQAAGQHKLTCLITLIRHPF